MTKKDYKLIAETFKQSLEDCANDVARSAVRVTAQRLSVSLQRENPRFNSEKFLAACGAD